MENPWAYIKTHKHYLILCGTGWEEVCSVQRERFYSLFNLRYGKDREE